MVEASGYSISGIVIGVGKNIHNFVVGDRVAAAGGTAVHAEYVEVPEKLVVKIHFLQIKNTSGSFKVFTFLQEIFFLVIKFFKQFELATQID